MPPGSPAATGEYSLRLRIGRRVLALRPGALLLTAAGVALFGTLGQWQVGRAAAQRTLERQFARATGPAHALSSALERVPRYQRVEVGGRYDARHQILLDNITLDGRVGYYVLTPLRRGDGALLLVNRGWVPQGASRGELPDIAVDDGLRTVTGRVDELPRAGIHLAAPGAVDWPRVMNFPDSSEVAAALGGRVYPQILLLDPAVPDGYRRAWRPPGLGPLRHLAYAVQWFALALTAVILLVVMSLRTPDEPR